MKPALTTILAIASSTFREALRARVFLYLIAVAAVMVGASVPTAALGIGEQVRLVTDVSLGGASFVGVFLSLFLGVSAVSGEIERRTVYAVIAKAVSRRQFVVGKYLGVWATVAVALVAAHAMTIGLVALLSGVFPASLLLALFMAIFEMGLLIALAVFFSCFTRSLLSSGLALALYVVGTTVTSLFFWVERSKSELVVSATRALYVVLPNFELFDIKTELIHALEVPLGRLCWAALYGLIYSAALLGLGTFIFGRRDLK